MLFKSFIFNALLLCTLAAFHGKFSVVGQDFTFSPATNVNQEIYGNRSGDVDIAWTYSYSAGSLAGGNIFCGFVGDNVISKNGDAAPTVVGKYSGRAVVIYDANLRRLGFKLRLIQFADAREFQCNAVVGGQQFYSGKFKLNIYERPVFINCLDVGTTLVNNVKTFVLREGQTLNSTCFVYGNPVPNLVCTTFDSRDATQATLPGRKTNYTSIPINNRMLFSNVRRAVAKVRCVADGGVTGRETLERVVQVYHPPTMPLDVRLAESTYTTIKIRWKQPANIGISLIKDYDMELQHPNGTITHQNLTVTGSATSFDYTFSRLYRNQEYKIYVSAYNAIGKGDRSEVLTVTTVPRNPESGERTTDELSTGAIVGIVFGVLAGIVLILIVVFFVLKKRQDEQKYPKSYVEEAVDYPPTENAMYARVNKKKPMDVGANDSTSGYPDIIHQAKPEHKGMLSSQDYPEKPKSSSYESSRKEYV